MLVVLVLANVAFADDEGPFPVLMAGRLNLSFDWGKSWVSNDFCHPINDGSGDYLVAHDSKGYNGGNFSLIFKAGKFIPLPSLRIWGVRVAYKEYILETPIHRWDEGNQMFKEAAFQHWEKYQVETVTAQFVMGDEIPFFSQGDYTRNLTADYVRRNASKFWRLSVWTGLGVTLQKGEDKWMGSPSIAQFLRIHPPWIWTGGIYLEAGHSHTFGDPPGLDTGEESRVWAGFGCSIL
ncbi:hypothetical protein KKD19_00475 [Patescibacteria group bacterium]|nr:hypothetical protein [Patescibacteria group bacterium]